jgi:hypothetical protein
LMVLIALTVWNISFAQSTIPDFRVNENLGTVGIDEGSPSIAVDRMGNFMVVWRDDRQDPGGDIFAQRFSPDGMFIGNNFKLNDDGGSASQKSPSVACDADGHIVVVWQDFRHVTSDIYAQRYSSDGLRVGSNFRVNDEAGDALQWLPTVGVDGQGHFVIVWRDDRSGNFDVYAQQYANDGSPVGANFEVYGSINESNSARQPCIGVAETGAFGIVWTGHGLSHGDIYGRFYSQDGKPLGNRFLVNERNNIVGEGNPDRWPFCNGPSIGADETGNFIIVWQDRRNLGYESDIYAQHYSADGSPVGMNFRVNDDEEDAAQIHPSVNADEATGSYVVVWADRRLGNDEIGIYAQRYTPDGTPIGGNFRVSRPGTEQQYAPEVELMNDVMYTAWKSYDKDSGYNVWASVVDWRGSSPAESTCRLRQSYPNPFSSRSSLISGGGTITTIAYELFVTTDVWLTVYDLRGRKVRTLVSTQQTAGFYTEFWDGRDDDGIFVASGVYICALQVGHERLRSTRVVFMK